MVNEFFCNGLTAYDLIIDRLYSVIEAENVENEGITIRLSEIPSEREEEIHLLLEAKLKEYTTRLEGKVKSYEMDMMMDSYSATGHFLSTVYKRDVARLLLEKSEVNTWNLTWVYRRLMGMILEKQFSNACGVVHDYTKTGGVNCRHNY